MLGVQTDEATFVLEALDFTPGCEHSQHLTDARHHGGPATHLVRLVHFCRGEGGCEYLACAKWAAFLNSGVIVVCRACSGVMPVSRFAIVVRAL